jgi:hypothetical protein
VQRGRVAVSVIMTLLMCAAVQAASPQAWASRAPAASAAARQAHFHASVPAAEPPSTSHASSLAAA